jgi:alpha 1,6-mannosyltransferase
MYVPHTFPVTLYQTYKTKKIPLIGQETRNSWKLNDGLHMELYDDTDIEEYIKKYWNKDTMDFFKALPIGVMKADLWRYLIIYTHGGVYADLDCKCNVPVIDWKGIKDDPILIIGLENNTHFCQWVFYATKGHPCLKHVHDFIIKRYKHVGIDTSKPNFVHDTTGPGVWTDAIRNYLGMDNLSVSEIMDISIKSGSIKNVKILPMIYFREYYTSNLYGSQNWSDDYISWTDQVSQFH